MIFKFNQSYNIQAETLSGTGTAFFERDSNIRGIYVDNTGLNTVSLDYYPNLNYSASHKINLVTETSTNALVRSGVPVLDKNRSQIVYEIGADALVTIYYTLPHIGS